MKYLIVFLTLYQTSALFSSHIVGGNVSYQYLGSNQYKLTFKVYKDCDASVTTPFDGDSSLAGSTGASPFYIGVLRSDNGNDILTGSNKELYFKSKRKVKSLIINDCVDTNAACVEEAIYEKIITIPDPNVSYVVMHSRCCRNNGIENLDNIASSGGGSSKPGMTIYTIIPKLSSYTNNSAVFKSFPPLFLCKDQPVYFDHSATDADGDVLRYSLVQPLAGGGSNSPVVQSPSLSSLTDYAAWLSPYNLSNIVGGTPNISIDPNTGLLTCRPNTEGRYVVSVMVKEYRGNVLIDSTIRDFQFNVRLCDIPYSDVPLKSGTYNPITRTGEYQLNCKSRTIDFNLNSSNADGFYWNFGDPASGTKDTSTSRNATHTYTDTGVFLVKLVSYRLKNNALLCPDTVFRTVRVYPIYNTNFSIDASILCTDKSIQFNDLSAGTYGNAISWNWDFGNGNTSTQKNPSIQYSNPGTYYVKLRTTNIKQCEEDTTIPLIIYPKPNISATIPAICLGQTANLVSNVTVAPPSTIASYRWTLPGGVFAYTSNTTYTPATSTGGIINLWAKSDKGCVDSQNYNFTVYPPPTIVANNDVTICYNKSAQLSATGGVSYVWSPSNYLNNPTISNPIASPPYPTPIKYTVKGTDVNGCYNFDSVQVSFHTKPYISAGSDTSVCLNPSQFVDRVQLNGQGSFASVYWTPVTGLSNSTISNPMAKPSVNTEYIFHGTDANSCVIEDTVNVYVLDPNLDLLKTKDTTKCYYDTIQLTPLDQGQITEYLWSPPTGVSDIKLRSPLFTTKTTTVYELAVKNYCYSKKDSIKVTIPDLPLSNMPAIDSICNGDTYHFNLNTQHSYVWRTSDKTLTNSFISNPSCSPSRTSSYYITITDQFGCKNYDTMVLIVNYPPNITLFGLKPYLCKGDSMPLTAMTDVRATYKWWDNAFISPRDDTNRIVVYPPTTTTYFIKAASAINCYTIDSFVVNVEEPIIPFVTTPVRFCSGKYTNLNASGGYYYRWGPNVNIYDTLIPNPQVFPEKSIQYKVLISNNCFSDTAIVDVYVDTLPKIQTTPDTQIFRGQTITLEAKALGTLYEWSPKDQITNPFLSSISIEPTENTVYHISVLDDNKCEGKDSVSVKVYGRDVLMLPSGFTPNSDGVNDYFYVIKSLNVKKFNHLEVYNRWGETIFKAKNMDAKWDGTVGDKPAPSGTYLWSSEVVNHEGKLIKSSGSVELIR